MQLLTELQAEVLRYIRRYIADREYAPSLREIADRFGSDGIAACLDALQQKGCIRWQPGLFRSIESATGGPSSLQPLSAHFKCSTVTAKRDLAALRSRGLIVFEGTASTATLGRDLQLDARPYVQTGWRDIRRCP